MTAESTNRARLDFRLTALIWLHEHSGCTNPNRHRQRYRTDDQPHHAQAPYYTHEGTFRPMVFKICRDQAEMSPVQRNPATYPITLDRIWALDPKLATLRGKVIYDALTLGKPCARRSQACNIDQINRRFLVNRPTR